MKNEIISNDIKRYKRDKLSGNLALLGLVFECLYFMLMYKQVCENIQAVFSNGEQVYTFLFGISVILNLTLLLMIFLSSEELKGYNKKFSYVVWVIAAIQIVRIFGYPMNTLTNTLKIGGGKIISGGTFTALVIFLVASAACLICAGVLGFINSTRLAHYRANLENGKIDLAAALKEEEAAPTVEMIETNEAEVK